MSHAPAVKDRSIDALKGIAILGVVTCHAVGGGLPGVLGPLGSMGQNGVQLFFLISGYLTWQSLERQSGSEGRPGLRGGLRWSARHIGQLIPIFYLAIFCTLFFQGWNNRYWMGSSVSHVTAGNLLAHLTMVFGLFPQYSNALLSLEWYLGALVLFYLFAPFLYRLITTPGRALLFFLLAILQANLLPALLPNPLPETDAYVWQAYIGNLSFVPQLPVLAAGILLYLAMPALRRNRHDRLLGYALLACALVLLAGQMQGANHILYLPDAVLFAAAFALLFTSQQVAPCPVLVNPVFVFYGQISLPVYLFHIILLDYYDGYVPAVFGAPGDLFLKLAVLFGLTAALGAVLTRLYQPLVLRACRSGLALVRRALHRG